MDNADHDKDIFSIRLDREGLRWILKFCRAVKFILFLSIIIAIPSLITGVLQVSRTKNISFLNDHPLYKIYYVLYPYWWIVYMLLWVIQVYYYWKFSTTLKRAVQIPDEKGFNESFRHLYHNALLIIVVCIISFLGNGVSFLVNLMYDL